VKRAKTLPLITRIEEIAVIARDRNVIAVIGKAEALSVSRQHSALSP
jgi:hypothetical protein